MLTSLIQPEETLSLQFSTLTPLYTGGIGQWGDQLHPSGLLGSIRHFSCAVARALGDGTFESEVWGLAGNGQTKPRAKGVSLQWDFSALKPVKLPPKVPINENNHRSTWYFNQACEGNLTLRLTRLNLSDFHWKILRASLVIQTRHAMFGAKDQFGLGVLTLDNSKCLNPEPFTSQEIQGSSPKGKDDRWPELPLNRYAFAKIRIPVNRHQPLDTWQEKLKAGLSLRAKMRNALRNPCETDNLDRDTLRHLRHQMLGKLNQWGSAVNISAAYLARERPQRHEARVVVALRTDNQNQRIAVMKRFNQALNLKVADWIFGPAFKERHTLINRLAGWEER